jgi:hypothetical protein
MTVITRKYYGFYMAYLFVGKLMTGLSVQVSYKPECLAAGAKFGQWVEYLWSGRPNRLSPRV